MPYDSTVPRTHAEMTLFAQIHMDVFTLDGPAIGLTPELSTEFAGRGAAIQAAPRKQEAAKQAYRDATVEVNGAAESFVRVSSASIKAISGYAQTQPDPDVIYAKARLSPPRGGTPSAPPAQPLNAVATLQPGGSVRVDWKGSTAGITFVLQRQVLPVEGASAGWQDLPYMGTRPFTDGALPAGVREVQYRVMAVRGGRKSPWSEPASLTLVSAAAATPAAAAKQTPGIKLAA